MTFMFVNLYQLSVYVRLVCCGVPPIEGVAKVTWPNGKTIATSRIAVWGTGVSQPHAKSGPLWNPSDHHNTTVLRGFREGPIIGPHYGRPVSRTADVFFPVRLHGWVDFEGGTRDQCQFDIGVFSDIWYRLFSVTNVNVTWPMSI